MCSESLRSCGPCRGLAPVEKLRGDALLDQPDRSERDAAPLISRTSKATMPTKVETSSVWMGNTASGAHMHRGTHRC